MNWKIMRNVLTIQYRDMKTIKEQLKENDRLYHLLYKSFIEESMRMVEKAVFQKIKAKIFLRTEDSD